MDTRQWGQHAWEFLHAVTFNYPVNPTSFDKKIHKEFFHSLKHILPCKDCRHHFKNGIENIMPIEKNLESRDKLSRWLVDFHNSVNKRLGKPIQSYDSIREKYESMRGRCQVNIVSKTNKGCSSGSEYSSKRTQILLVIIILILVLLFIGVFYGIDYLSKRKKK